MVAGMQVRGLTVHRAVQAGSSGACGGHERRHVWDVGRVWRQTGIETAYEVAGAVAVAEEVACGGRQISKRHVVAVAVSVA